MQKHTLASILVLLCSAWSTGVMSEEMTSHAAHVHGEAQLTFVLDGNEAEVTLNTAAGNIYGFERAPANDEERERILQQQKMLTSGQWFEVAAQADCQVTGQELRTEGDSHGHADLFVNLQMVCKTPLKVTQLTLKLFEMAADIQKVQLQYLVDGVAGAQKLTSQTATVQLRP